MLEHSLVRSGYNKMYCVLQIQRLKICKNKLIIEDGTDVDDGGVDVPQNTDGVTRYPSQGGNPIPADDFEKYQVIHHQGDKKMSSKDFVDALARGSNLDAEDAFKSAIGTKGSRHTRK